LRQINVSRSTVHVLQDEHMHPYHFSMVQQLKEENAEHRIEFCRWLLRQYNRDDRCCTRILFTDESLFTREGIFYVRNVHYWVEKNPFVVRERNFQVRWKLNIWAEIIGDQLIGLCVLPNRITGENYVEFLTENLPDVLENLPLRIRETM